MCRGTEGRAAAQIWAVGCTMVLATLRNGRASGGWCPCAERNSGSRVLPRSGSGSGQPGIGSWQGVPAQTTGRLRLARQQFGEPVPPKPSQSTSIYTLGSLAWWDWEASLSPGAFYLEALGTPRLIQHSGGMEGSGGPGTGVLRGRTAAGTQGPSAGTCAEAGPGTGQGPCGASTLPLPHRQGEDQHGPGSCHTTGSGPGACPLLRLGCVGTQVRP